MSKYKTWIEISKKAIANNITTIRRLIKPKVKLWSVVKSNAYGHGLVDFAKTVNELEVDGFCVDSVAEGLNLRKNGIKKHILVLGPTLPDLFKDAEENKLTLTISNFDILNYLVKSKHQPMFHLKIDSGMHRQGFFPKEITQVIKLIKESEAKEKLGGVYTHFASAKDVNYPTYTNEQFNIFLKATTALEKAGFKKIIKHCSATGGTLVHENKYHLDAVRVGIGLYGLWPSKELFMQRKDINLKPALSWHTLISEVKNVKKGSFVGYDLTERVTKPTTMAILPIGYWHGFSRGLSGGGEVLVKGQKVKVLGKVSMDLVAIDISGLDCKLGDRVTIIGKQKGNELLAFDTAQKLGTIHYEFLTRINPLIKRIVV
ncbi:alanine racemase [Candidatus Wolfebacteria bacterium]|nr:alanine racemase [Candidatus Wolfebacteria bacterium]